MTAPLGLGLITGPFPTIVDALGAVALLALLVTRRWRRWLPIAVSVAAACFFLGLITCWVLGDLLDLFGVTLSMASRVWFGIGLAGFGLGVARLLFSRKRLAALWAASAAVLALVGGLGLNADLADFPTVGTLLGISEFTPIQLPAVSPHVPLAGWTSSIAVPSHGRVGLVKIPATTSGFPARDAVVYLPPAALVSDPPALPVLELLSGQPGQPADLFVKGHLARFLDAFAQTHGGLAPTVVVPDQLGSPSRNPMCVNSSLGKSATYLTVDVPRWIRSHLAVESGPGAWGIGGFSQGGTCAIQLGASLPNLYGTIFDISGEVAPESGSLQHTIDAGFAGSLSAYRAALPANIMSRVGPYAQTFAVFAVGAADTRYGPGLRTVAADASAAGMRSRVLVSPGTAHDWRTVMFAFDHSVPLIAENWGLNG